MIVYYVAGGSYKSFYLNYLKKINKCDLLIFNYGIFYSVSDANKAVLTKEIIQISKMLQTVVIVGVKLNDQKKVVVCVKGKIKLYSLYKGCVIKVKNKCFYIGAPYQKIYHYNKIIFTNKQIIPNLKACNKTRIYLFCDNKGVNFVVNKKLKRNFNKCSKFILK